MAISTAIAFLPGVAIVLSVIGFNVLGNGLRDVVSNGPA
jgi:ABC-type dipeptide/oligopeptide/nickel transport system permease subunit